MNDNQIQANEDLPEHVGLILDGNRRWAKAQGLPTFEGHRQGYDNLKKIIKHAHKRGVSYVSAFIFSTENWKRAEEEVSYLMNLALKMATKDVEELNRDNVRVRFLGRRERLSQKLLDAIDRAEEMTEDNTAGTIALCFNYGGKQEIVDAFKQLIKKGIKAADVTVEQLAQYLYAPDIPDVDLLIRTSGEQRISNFMLWRVAYCEMYFTEKHWPAFTEGDFDDALDSYINRDRRYGK